MVYCCGEIGKVDAKKIYIYLEEGLSDEHHSVRKVSVGAIKQMGEKNWQGTYELIQRNIKNSNLIVRKEIIHGIELRGRTNPEDVLEK